MTVKSLLALVFLTIMLAGCVADDVPISDLFPGQVGEFLRTSGPAPDPATRVDVSIYESPSSAVTLRIRRVGADQIEHALSQLPPTATSVGYDPAMGQRDGVFFAFGEEYHAAWGNGDWVFVLSATSEAGRIAFLSAYGY